MEEDTKFLLTLSLQKMLEDVRALMSTRPELYQLYSQLLYTQHLVRVSRKL